MRIDDVGETQGLGPVVFLADPAREATASLHVIHGQYLFESGPTGARRQKWVSSEAVAEAFTGVGFDTGWLAPDVLRWGRGLTGEWVVAYRAPAVHRLTVVGEGMPEGAIPVPLPGLVLFGLGTEWHVWAVKSRGRFDPKGKCYVVPTPNVGNHGQICFGENPVPRASPLGVGAAWAAYLETPFNDHNVRGKCRSEPDDVRNLLVSLARSRAKTFPGDELAGGEHTIEAVVASLVNPKGAR